jgi:membrane-associated protease RseP (regulator of RpoE activity)
MQNSYAVPTSELDPIEQISNSLRNELTGLFQVTSVTARSRGEMISFSGHLLNDTDASYIEISRRFQSHGYTPLLRREKGEDVVLAMEGLVDASKTGNPIVNILLLAATIFTTLGAGAAMVGVNMGEAIFSGSLEKIIDVILAGAPFAIALLGILGVHEFGHYIAAQWHRVRTSLPYFIPLPAIGIGTLGAFITTKSPIRNRKVLLDIGLAGPYAGLALALPLILIGLLLSDAYVPKSQPGLLTLERLGSSILIRLLIIVFTDVPEGYTLAVHPVFYAAWLGLFLTGINLLPVGQLDGGHAAYALLGRYSHIVAYIVFFLLIAAGMMITPAWFFLAFFIVLGGLRHQPPMNDITDVGFTRKLIGLFSIILFVLIITPPPFLLT